MNNLMYIVAVYPVFIATLFAFMYIIVKHERRHHILHVLTIIGGACIVWGISMFLKEIIEHPRPDLTGALFIPGDKYSFPSGHAAYMFGLAFLMRHFDTKAQVILLVLAALTGIARVMSGVHYWYDIVGGIIFGFLIAELFVFVVSMIKKSTHKYG